MTTVIEMAELLAAAALLVYAERAIRRPVFQATDWWVAVAVVFGALYFLGRAW